MLTEALSVWESGGAVPRAHQVAVLLGRLQDADSSERSRARAAARELQRLGLTHVHGVAVSARVGAAAVAVEVLGGFRVLVDDVEVPATAWRSRQARTLIKILAARHGRPTTRAWLCETLWPDDDPAKTGHRLSVLLTTLRGVLDPDRAWPADRFVGADSDGVWLDRTHVAVDAVTLVRDADSAASLMDAGEIERAREILADVNERYRGDAFEDEQSEEWADGAREEVRAAWQRSVRRLAALARRAGRIGDAQTLLVRLLTADPYDERIHELLVRNLLASGRRGEARRAFDRWSAAMREIGAPAPDATILQTRAPRRSRAGHRPRPRGRSDAVLMSTHHRTSGSRTVRHPDRPGRHTSRENHPCTDPSLPEPPSSQPPSPPARHWGCSQRPARKQPAPTTVVMSTAPSSPAPPATTSSPGPPGRT
jgi:DNA-binding SARP family transcriptional activator